jgi:hypothetical protein
MKEVAPNLLGLLNFLLAYSISLYFFRRPLSDPLIIHSSSRSLKRLGALIFSKRSIQS